MAANFDFTPIWNVADQGDRRLGMRQRVPENPGTSSLKVRHDRRLGLGRRWADWRRPVAASTPPGVAIATGALAPQIR
jgi:hypothetical protein